MELGDLIQQVAFGDLEAYLEEIADDAEHVDNKIVRCDVEHGEGQGAKRIILRSSYSVGIGFRVFAMDCGTHPGGRGEVDGLDRFKEAAGKIRAVCEQHGLRLKRGIVM